VWKNAGPIRTDSGLAIVATTSLEDAWTAPDILFAPGGLLPTFELLDDAAVIDFLRARGAQAKWVTSVCTGAVLLGAAGLLDGLEATTYWADMEMLEQYGARPTEQRVVEQGKIVTAAGVSSGIDMALTLVARMTHDEVAKAIQLGIEYDPEPPFDSGSTRSASPETIALVRATIAARDEARA
jgi:cyclohexyl-isocyanide hydratase